MTGPTIAPHACFDHQRIPRLGMGCWTIGGPFTIEGNPQGYGEVDDAESARAIHTAVDHGVRYFDTAAAYGTGHSERVLGEALAGEPDVFISTKIGFRMDESSRTILGAVDDAESVIPAIEASLRRLQRDQIDLLFLHLDDLTAEQAAPMFDQMERAVSDGKVRAYGWSNDAPEPVSAIGDRKHFVAVQHMMNAYFDAPEMMPVVRRHGLVSVSRSPLAMGLLTGKYDENTELPDNDVRSNDFDWNLAFKNGRVREERLDALVDICECLRVGGRTTAQGALAWLWAHAAETVPICGFRNSEQAKQNASALEFGPLPDETMREIEDLVDRSTESE